MSAECVDAAAHADQLAADPVPCRLAAEDARRVLADAIATKPEQMARIVRARLNEEPSSSTELGAEFGIAPTRVLQLECESLAKLRRSLSRQGAGFADLLP